MPWTFWLELIKCVELRIIFILLISFKMYDKLDSSSVATKRWANLLNWNVYALNIIGRKLTSFISFSYYVPQHDEDINDKNDDGSRC